jgi:hypothetical protein
LDQLRPGDTLVVWKLDRLGRALWQLVDTVTSLAERGIGFRSLPEAVDTTTPWQSRLPAFAALAEFERDLIRERTAAGLAAARARGHRGGRPSVLTGTSCGRPGAVPVGAVHGGGDRHDSRVSAAPRLPTPHSCRHPTRVARVVEPSITTPAA